MTYQQFFFVGTLALTAIMSGIAFLTFRKDKKLARSGKERIKEKTLLGLSACFGSFGAFIGRIVAHHKTDKAYFSIVILFSMLLHLSLLGYLGYLAFVV